MKITLSGFNGANRALHPMLLPESVGVTSLNQKPGRGDLRPWKEPATVATVPSGRKTIYRMGRDVAENQRYWLSWTGDVYAVRGFESDDTTERTYYTGDGAPKVTDNLSLDGSDPQSNPIAWRPLGLPAPTSGPDISGVSEPAPSMVTEHITVDVDQFVINSGVATVITRSAHRLSVGQSFQYSLGGDSWGPVDGVGVVSYVSSDVSFGFPLSQTNPQNGHGSIGVSYTHAVADTKEQETRFYVYTYVNDWGWESAPSPPSVQLDCAVGSTCSVTGFASVPSGNYNINRVRVYRTQAGSTGAADFYFLAEAAYPASSVADSGQALGEPLPTTTWLTPPDDLSNLTALWNGMMAGISGNSVRFCEAYTTYAWPIAYDVIPPDSKPVALGVYGQNLLVLTTGRPLLVAGSSPDSMDQQPIDLHQACVAPKSVVSIGHGVVWASMDGLMYYGSGGAKMLTAGLMTRDDWQAINPASMTGCLYEGLYSGSYHDGVSRKGFSIDPVNPQGIYFLNTGYEVSAYDELLDQLFVLDGVSVQRWDAGSSMSYTFKSKVFRTPRPVSMACAHVVADAYPVTFKLFGDGALVFTQTVTSRNPFRLPPGMYDHWQIELTGTGAVQGAAVASSMSELKEV